MTKPYSCVPAAITDNLAISNAAIRLYLVMASYADRERECRPAVKTLAARMGITERSVRKLLVELVKHHAIERTARTNDRGVSIANAYRMLGWEEIYPVQNDRVTLAKDDRVTLAKDDTPSTLNRPREQTKGKESAPQTLSVAPEPKRPKRVRRQYEAEYEELWRTYPKRDPDMRGPDNKQACWKHWVSDVKSDDPNQIILAAAAYYAEHHDDPFRFGLRSWLEFRRYRDPVLPRRQSDQQKGFIDTANEILAEYALKNGNGEHHDANDEILTGARAGLPVAIGGRH